MRIVMTTDTFWPRVNGVTVAIDTFRRHLMRKGHTVYLLAPRYPPAWAGFAVSDDPHVYRFPSFRFPPSPEDRLGYPMVRHTIGRLLEELRPDVVHAHTEFTIGFAGKRYCQRRRVAHVMTCHTSWEQYIRAYCPAIPGPITRTIVAAWSLADYRLIDRLTVPSRVMERRIRSYGARCPIDIIPNGVSPEEFCLDEEERDGRAADFARAIPGLSERRVLLYAGRLAPEKNLDFLLDVVQRVIPRVPAVLLLLAGSGPGRARLEARVRAQNLAHHVTFTGYLDHRQLSYLHTMAAAFVFPSKTETQGLVIAEAMTCGTPVVAIRAMGTEEVLVDDRGGFLVDEDVARFAEKVLLLLTDPSVRALKSREAAHVAREFTVDKMSERLLATYELAIDGKREPAHSSGRASLPGSGPKYW